MRSFVPSKFPSSQLPYYLYRVRHSRPVTPLKVSLFSFPSSLKKPYSGFYLPYKHTLKNAFFYDFSYKYFFLNWRRYEIRQNYAKIFKNPNKFPNFVRDFTHFYDFKAAGFKSRYFKKKYRSFLYLKSFIKRKKSIFRSFRLSPKRFDKRINRFSYSIARFGSRRYFRKNPFGSPLNKLRMFHTKSINRYRRKTGITSILTPIIKQTIRKLALKKVSLKYGLYVYVVALNSYGAAINKIFKGRGFIFKAINFYKFRRYNFGIKQFKYYLHNPLWRIYFSGIGGRFRASCFLPFYIKRYLLYKRFFKQFEVATNKNKFLFLLKRYFRVRFFRSEKKQIFTKSNSNSLAASNFGFSLVARLFRGVARLRYLYLIFNPSFRPIIKLRNSVFSFHIKKFLALINLIKLRSTFTSNISAGIRGKLFKKFDALSKINYHVTVKRNCRSRFWSIYFRRYIIRLFRFFTFFALIMRCLTFSRNSQLFFRLRKKFIIFLFKFVYNGKGFYTLFFSFYRHLYFGLVTPPTSHSFMYSLPDYSLIFKDPKIVISKSNIIQFKSVF
jgi:hypothetical protein